MLLLLLLEPPGTKSAASALRLRSGGSSTTDDTRERALVPLLQGWGVDWVRIYVEPTDSVAGGLSKLVENPIVWLCCLAFFCHVPIEAATATWAGARRRPPSRALRYSPWPPAFCPRGLKGPRCRRPGRTPPRSRRGSAGPGWRPFPRAAPTCGSGVTGAASWRLGRVDGRRGLPRLTFFHTSFRKLRT